MQEVFKLMTIFALISATFSQESIKVTGLPNQNQEVYNGWIYSDSKTESYLYYHLYSAINTTFNNSQSTPFIVYLAGGPGASSVITALTEIGPYGISGNYEVGDKDYSNLYLEIVNRNVTWTEYYHLLTIDNPVGVGLSYSLNNQVVNNSNETAEQLFNFLTRFYEIYPSLQSNPMFIVGRSYGGHWGTTLGYKILSNNYTLPNNVKLDLRGMFYSGGLINLGNQSRWSNLYYASGSTFQNLADQLSYNEINITLMEWENQYVFNSYAFLSEFGQFVMQNATPHIIVDNLRQVEYKNSGDSAFILYEELGPTLFNQLDWTNITTARTAFNVPLNVSWQTVDVADPYFASGDLAAPYNNEILAFLANNISVGFLTGQDDGNLGYAGACGMVFGLDWEGMKDYRKSPRNLLVAPNGTVVGSFKNGGLLSQYSVFKAGHLVTMDQPVGFLAALENYITRIVG